jgi:hypothetical protein
MRRLIASGALVASILGSMAVAGDVKTYQVTGPVLDVAADSITVQKGKENWQIAKSPSTKGGADVKKGDKVTVYYQMTASDIEGKAAPAAKAPAAKAPAKK